MYGGCWLTDPECVDQDRLHNEQRETLLEGGGEKIGYKKWWYPADESNYSSRGGTPIDHVVIHTAEGYTGGLDTFRSPSRNASAHYAMGWDGTRVMMVREEDKAWHAGAKGSSGEEIHGMNERSIGIEHVGFAHAMQPGSVTEWSKPMLKGSAKLVAELARRYNIPIDRDHIISHAEVDPSRRSDPGPHWPWSWYIRKIKWYYYRPYVIVGGAFLLFGGLWYAARKREEKRIAGWKKI